MKIIICLLLLIFITMVTSDSKKYKRHKILSVVPKTERHIKLLNRLSDKYGDNFEILKYPQYVGDSMCVRIGPRISGFCTNMLKSKGMEVTVIVHDLQKSIKEEKQQNAALFAGEISDIQLDQFHPLPNIMSYLTLLAQEYPEFVKTIDLGRSLEGNIMAGIKVSTSTDGRSKPIVWIDSGIHAREWAAVSVLVYLIHTFTVGSTQDPEIMSLLDTFDFYFFPVVNPDGYIYTWTTDRMWRKNRSNPSAGKCAGVDLNRNWDIGFYDDPFPKGPCTEEYAGPQPFSEPESQVLRDGILSLGSNLKVVINVHAYGRLWLSPYSYSRQKPKDYAAHMNALQAAQNAIQAVGGQPYRIGPISSTMSAVKSGSTVDWIYEKAKVKYTFAIEVRGEGFTLPKDQIIPNAVENLAAIKAVLNVVRTQESFAQG